MSSIAKGIFIDTIIYIIMFYLNYESTDILVEFYYSYTVNVLFSF